MNNSAQVEELSELENLEFNRRLDIAYGVIPAAGKLFGERYELEERIKEASKSINRHWPWIAFVVALLVHYFILDGGSNFTWASWIALMVIAWWILKQYEIGQLQSQRNQYNKWLLDLEVIWRGANGYGSFWEISRFVNDGYFENDNDEFDAWWADQNTNILLRVCGYERGERISKELARRSSEFRRGLQEFQQKRGGNDE